jgi:hypothetical protein
MENHSSSSITNNNTNKKNSAKTSNNIYHLEKEAKGIFGKKWDKRDFEINGNRLIWKEGNKVKGKLDLKSVNKIEEKENKNKNKKSLELICSSIYKCTIYRKNDNTEPNKSRMTLKLRGSPDEINSLKNRLDNLIYKSPNDNKISTNKLQNLSNEDKEKLENLKRILTEDDKVILKKIGQLSNKTNNITKLNKNNKLSYYNLVSNYFTNKIIYEINKNKILKGLETPNIFNSLPDENKKILISYLKKKLNVSNITFSEKLVNKTEYMNMFKYLLTEYNGQILSSQKRNLFNVHDSNINRQIPTSDINFSIFTFNIFERNCPNFKSITKSLEKYNPDVICTQEDRSYDNIGDYKSINKIKCGTFNETVGVYEKKNNLTTFIKCISSTPAKNIDYASTRSAFIFSYQNLIIANIHLEGGRYVDQELLKNFDKLLSYKIKLLNMLLSSNYKPDIIVGDFNSVYHSKEGEILQKFLEGQYSYFESMKGELNEDEKENIKMWNLAPILYMKKMGYEQAIPTNEDKVITNGRGNTIVDFIFYKKDKIEFIDCEIIDVMKNIRNYSNSNAISDHNPIFAKFKIIS